MIQDTLVRFECIIDALPKPKVTWYLNDKELTVKDNVKFETDVKTSSNVMVIPKVTSNFIGFYSVKVSNIVGEIEHKFKLEANGIFFFKTYKQIS